ncbi:MAG: hypothetical protein JW828_16560 [Sedimentisphaerales bacterium]|nr:hypothetical protein [Sedimentisphaerales bacterium]
MTKRIIRWLAIILNICLLGFTVLVIIAFTGDYDMEWAQAPLLLIMVFTPIVNILALLPRDARRASQQRRMERALNAFAQHFDVAIPSGLSEEVERLAKDPKQKQAAIRLHRKQARLSRAEARIDIDTFLKNTPSTDNPM